MMQPKRSAPALSPETSVQYLKGVGPRLAQVFAGMGIHTLEELLHYYPRAWEDRRQFRPISGAEVEREMTFKGTIESAHFLETRGGFAVASVILKDASGALLCRWLRRRSFRYDVLAGLREELKTGAQIIVHGKVSRDLTDKILTVFEHEVLTGCREDYIHVGRIVPVYPMSEGVRPRFFRRLIYDLLGALPLSDPIPAGALPPPLRTLSLAAALKKIHFPSSFPEKEEARKRLAYQEIFLTQTVLALIRRRTREERSTRLGIKRNLLTPFRERCGFEFTAAQKKAINEIFADMTSGAPMNRMLQGDVGSGKTVVALSAMLLACENRLQSALMAPTEILAEQHAITLRHFLAGLPVRTALLTGAVKGKERNDILERAARGEIDILIGTHALLEKEVRFAHLGLAVIDEQHRFGVRHRLLLTQRKPAPDVLVMSATPIPRTLALALYGDLDCSTIEGLPPGRREIRTQLAAEAEAYGFLKAEVAQGRQAYVVFPLVDESDKVELKAAIREFEKLKAGIFSGIPVGLLHGQMPGSKKEKVMRDFHEGRFSILVATTVIEVGIDVPNATAMVIQHAERFGLATLHQLRGRIGRGEHPSTCLLVAHSANGESRERIDILLSTRDGFELAEKDLALRGPGEIFGTSQHGLPPFRIADLSRDRALILQAQKAARERVEADPELSLAAHAALREELRRRFGKVWFWGHVA